MAQVPETAAVAADGRVAVPTDDRGKLTAYRSRSRRCPATRDVGATGADDVHGHDADGENGNDVSDRHKEPAKGTDDNPYPLAPVTPVHALQRPGARTRRRVRDAL